MKSGLLEPCGPTTPAENDCRFAATGLWSREAEVAPAGVMAFVDRADIRWPVPLLLVCEAHRSLPKGELTQGSYHHTFYITSMYLP